MLAELVRTYRRRLGMTQRDLAAAANISVRSIRKIETGSVAQPRPSTIRALAAAFGLSEAARARLHDEPVAVNGEHRTDESPEPLVVVAIEATGGQHDDRLYVQVTVRSATGAYSTGPFPIERRSGPATPGGPGQLGGGQT